VTREFICGQGLDELLQMRVGTTVYTYHTDAQGNVVALTNASGTIVEKYRYDVYGRLTDAWAWKNGASVQVVDGDYDGDGEIDQGASADGFFDKEYFATSDIDNPYLFQSQRLDATGLYYFRNRYYDPENGRFITRDPARDGLNLYAFVNNNPINFMDPLGLLRTLSDQAKADLQWLADHHPDPRVREKASNALWLDAQGDEQHYGWALQTTQELFELTGLGASNFVYGVLGKNGNAYDDEDILREYTSDLMWLKEVLDACVAILDANQGNDPTSQDNRTLALWVLKKYIPMDEETQGLLSKGVETLETVESALSAASDTEILDILKENFSNEWVNRQLASGQSIADVGSTALSSIEMAISAAKVISTLKSGQIPSDLPVDKKIDVLEEMYNIGFVAANMIKPGFDCGLLAHVGPCLDAVRYFVKAWGKQWTRENIDQMKMGQPPYRTHPALFSPEDLEQAKRELGVTP